MNFYIANASALLRRGPLLRHGALASATLALGLLSGHAYAEPMRWMEFQQAHVLRGRATEGPRTGTTTSEGQGLAMLWAVKANDRAAFEALWTFAQIRLQQPNGLLAWTWQPRARTETNNASLGDVYVAWALLRASST